MPLPSPISRNKSIAPQPQPREALPENTPLEFHVLLSACRLFLGTKEPAALEALLKEGPDWGRLTTLANRHGVMPLLYRSLGRVDRELVPQETMARLRVMYMHNAARNIRMTGELLRILDAFKDAGIRAVPLKGPVLAEQLYGDVALRQFSDLDILVKREDADRALEILEAKGYSVIDDPRKEKSKKKRVALLKYMYHYELNNELSGMHVELHWQLSQSFRRLNVDKTAIRDRIRTIRFQKREILSLSNEDCLVYLCQHGASHLWKRLSWLCDVSLLIAINNNSQSSALEIAKEAKNERIFYLGLLLAEGLMNVTVQKEIVQTMKADEELVSFCERIILDIVSLEDSKNDSSQRVSDLILYNKVFSYREKAAFYADLFMTPTKPDFDSVAIPDILFPAYKLVRTIRLMKDYREAFKKQLKGS